MNKHANTFSWIYIEVIQGPISEKSIEMINPNSIGLEYSLIVFLLGGGGVFFLNFKLQP